MKIIIENTVLIDTENARRLACSNVDGPYEGWMIHENLYQNNDGQLVLESYQYVDDDYEGEIAIPEDYTVKLLSTKEAIDWIGQFGDDELIAYLSGQL